MGQICSMTHLQALDEGQKNEPDDQSDDPTAYTTPNVAFRHPAGDEPDSDHEDEASRWAENVDEAEEQVED